MDTAVRLVDCGRGRWLAGRVLAHDATKSELHQAPLFPIVLRIGTGPVRRLVDERTYAGATMNLAGELRI